MQTGMIILWNYLQGPIPTGFIVCDGTNGTPQLQNKFVRGANAPNPPGSTGGAWNHNHTYNAGSHSHELGPGEGIESGDAIDTETDGATVSGTTANQSEVPPYIAMDWIMKT